MTWTPVGRFFLEIFYVCQRIYCGTWTNHWKLPCFSTCTFTFFVYLSQHDTCPVCRKSLDGVDNSLQPTSEPPNARSLRTDQQERQAIWDMCKKKNLPPHHCFKGLHSSTQAPPIAHKNSLDAYRKVITLSYTSHMVHAFLIRVFCFLQHTALSALHWPVRWISEWLTLTTWSNYRLAVDGCHDDGNSQS